MKNTISKLQKKEKLTMITAYDALFAKIFDDIADIILVGDSLNMSFMGENDTLTATMEQMIYHTKAVCNGAKKAFIVCDMPFGSYSTPNKALENAIRVYKETKADAVKLEGGAEKADTVKLLTNNAIAVVGHIGLMPQFSRSEGGYKVKGKDEISRQKLLEDAKAIEEAGAVMLVIEGVKEEVAKEITEIIKIPTIGIGAGRYTTGQVLVWSDMLGFFESFKPKFVRRYLNGAEMVRVAVKKYVDDVKNSKFPSVEEIY
ncbi:MULTISPECIES: 3-methyl-2-oxobutanoate hydroxymethyltransferase [unclassified Lebetimonas]|uniref:3-methyl-2-oxobutanoate hydroxymethyltransferase n=1 Tax=unclassified Lebetimonas TaxID=2648158 RepID=UPI0004666459|nr:MULTISPECIES: 3-methyl-2-oxobutanoate hydroxymethyltransferase [unclassified Lebetimonas]